MSLGLSLFDIRLRRWEDQQLSGILLTCLIYCGHEFLELFCTISIDYLIIFHVAIANRLMGNAVLLTLSSLCQGLSPSLGFSEVFLVLRLCIIILFGTIFADSRLGISIVAASLGLHLHQIYIYATEGVILAGYHRHVAQICAEFTLKLVLVSMLSVGEHHNVLIYLLFHIPGLLFTS